MRPSADSRGAERAVVYHGRCTATYPVREVIYIHLILKKIKSMQRGPWHRTAGLFYGVGVHSGDRYDSFGEISRHELDGEECKAINISIIRVG